MGLIGKQIRAIFEYLKNRLDSSNWNVLELLHFFTVLHAMHYLKINLLGFDLMFLKIMYPAIGCNKCKLLLNWHMDLLYSKHILQLLEYYVWRLPILELNTSS